MLVQHQPHLESMLVGVIYAAFYTVGQHYTGREKELTSVSSLMHLPRHPGLPETSCLISPLCRILQTMRIFHRFQPVSPTFDGVDHLESGLHLLSESAVKLPVTALPREA